MLADHPLLSGSIALLTLLSSSLVLAQEPPAARVENEKEAYPPAWFRIDSDASLLQLWAGATHPLSDSVGLATDIYVNSGSLGEFDIGPAWTVGPLVVTPMLGIQFDWALKKASAIVPQLYVVGGPDPIYFELWVQNYLYTPFDYPNAQAVNRNYVYTRLFVDYKVGKYFAIGPQLETTLYVSGDGDSLGSLPVGGSILLSNYGVGGSLLVFLGYETKKEARAGTDGTGAAFDDHGLVGRLTFVKNF